MFYVLLDEEICISKLREGITIILNHHSDFILEDGSVYKNYILLLDILM